MAVDGAGRPVDDDVVDFGAAVKRELRNQNRNQEWLARALGIDRATVSRLLSSRSPTLKEVDQIAEALELSPVDLLRAAGYITEATSVEELLAGDVSLAAGEREMLLAAYRAAKALPR